MRIDTVIDIAFGVMMLFVILASACLPLIPSNPWPFFICAGVMILSGVIMCVAVIWAFWSERG